MKTIVTIEDDEHVLDNIIDTLEAEGYSVQGASNGIDGIRLVHECLPDLVICDILMPVLDGYGVLEKLREDLRTAAIPIILLTGKTDRQDMRKGMDLGADDYIMKPFSPSELVSAVGSRLERQDTYSKVSSLYAQVSELERIRQEKNLRDLQTRFVNMISHELRTPLAKIQTATYLIREYGDRLPIDQKADSFESIQNSIADLARISTQVAEVKQVTTRQYQIKQTSFNLADMCHALVNEIQGTSASHRIVFTSPIKHPSAVMFEDLMRPLIVNLLVNAIQYSPTGGAVHFELKYDKPSWVMRVSDAGIGIPEQDQQHIFDAFYRGSNVFSIPGIGLGLYVAKVAAELHNGTIQFDTREDHGTTFTVILQNANQVDTDHDNHSRHRR